jgi:hypothetical protein
LARSSDDQGVGILVLFCALAIGFAAALGLSRLVLGAVLNTMTGQRSPALVTIQWRRIAFVAGLFWLWYLVPTLAAAATRSTAAVIFRHLLGN